MHRSKIVMNNILIGWILNLPKNFLAENLYFQLCLPLVLHKFSERLNFTCVGYLLINVTYSFSM